MEDNPQGNLFDNEPKKPNFQHKKPERLISDSGRLTHLKYAKQHIDSARSHGGPGAIGRVLRAREYGHDFEQRVKTEPLRRGSTYSSVGEMIESTIEDLHRGKIEKTLGCTACKFYEDCVYVNQDIKKPILDGDYQVTDPLVSKLFGKKGKKTGEKLIYELEKDINRSCPEIIDQKR